MTTLLERAMQQTEQLPTDKQDWIAETVLEMIQDEAEWDRQFAESGDVIAQLVAEAAAEYAAGRARKLP